MLPRSLRSPGASQEGTCRNFYRRCQGSSSSAAVSRCAGTGAAHRSGQCLACRRPREEPCFAPARPQTEPQPRRPPRLTPARRGLRGRAQPLPCRGRGGPEAPPDPPAASSRAPPVPRASAAPDAQLQPPLLPPEAGSHRSRGSASRAQPGRSAFSPRFSPPRAPPPFSASARGRSAERGVTGQALLFRGGGRPLSALPRR